MKLSECCGVEQLDSPFGTVCPRCKDFAVFEVVCPECLEPRPDDERVAGGMKCARCAYGFTEGR